ncbi:MAG: hypothetical protein WDO17_05045 [Alphaproteobacteria bacterium]
MPGVIWFGGRTSPQRSATHTLAPSGSTATALVEPHLRPSGSSPQFAMVRYGFGSELVGAVVCAAARVVVMARAKASARVRVMG